MAVAQFASALDVAVAPVATTAGGFVAVAVVGGDVVLVRVVSPILGV